MKKAFTIIETLVAITILMIAISGPLTSAFRAMTASVAARDQMTANFLAQDAMEYVRNVKDNNVLNKDVNGPLHVLSGCNAINKCYVDTLNTNQENAIEKGCQEQLSEECHLYKTSTGRFTYNPTGNQPTNFYRSFYLTNITAVSARAVVDVVWQTGAYDIATTTLQNDLYYVVK
jgi:type II secretory pathway pseudopilin PulG